MVKNMTKAVFTALILAKEINLNLIAKHFNVNRKFHWEEPFILKTENLRGIIKENTDKYIYE